MKPATLLALAICLFTTPVAAQSTPPVPAEYQDLYAALSSSVTSFRTTIEQQWDGTRVPVAFSANLTTANSSRGPALLAPYQGDAVRLELDSLKALGVKAVSVEINFPMLYEPFLGSQTAFQQYLGFYQQVARDVRARGLTLIVQTQALFSDGTVTGWNLAPYYASLSLDQYEQGRLAVAETIAQNLNPDYLSVIQEPDTEAAETGKPELGTLDGSDALLNLILNGLQAAGIPGVAVGAGFGTWQSGYTSWANQFASSGIDFLDMHVYPANLDFLPRALDIADIAHSYGKQVGMSETWLYKVRDSELQAPTSSVLLARDVYSFWAPLDAQFLQTMVEFAEFKQLDFLSAFWSIYFHAYVDYGPTTSGLSPAALNQLAQAALATNMQAGTYTSTGLAYENAIVVPPDVTPPSQPTSLSAQLTSPTSVVVSWSAASDDVGTAAYQVFRDGTLLTQTAWTYFRDSGLDLSRTYTYTVVASDALGHQSAPAVVTTPSTRDVTPPTVSISYPTGGSRLSRAVTFYAAACDMRGSLYEVPSGVAGVQFQIDGVNAGPEQTVPTSVSGPCGAYQVSYDTRRLPNGTHLITATARDAAGNRRTSAAVTVRIRN